MRILIDTNAYISFCKGNKDSAEVIRVASEIFIPVIVLGELRAGFRSGTQGKSNERTLQSFLNSPRVSVLSVDEETIHHYALIFAELRKLGKPIPTNDMWIAGLGVQHSLPLFSYDRHFDEIAQLGRVETKD